jgi:hypothetical protein
MKMPPKRKTTRVSQRIGVPASRSLIDLGTVPRPAWWSSHKVIKRLKYFIPIF